MMIIVPSKRGQREKKGRVGVYDVDDMKCLYLVIVAPGYTRSALFRDREGWEVGGISNEKDVTEALVL